MGTKWSESVVAVTGASRGIGRAIAQAAAAHGARVGLIARSEEELGEVLRSIGGRGAVAVADVGDPRQVHHAVTTIEAELAPVDILVANAGIGAYGPFASIDEDEIERLMRINYLGTVYAIKAVLPGMLERGRGHIVVISSVAGRFGTPFEGAYAASKFAQIGLAEALAVELSSAGIGVSIIDPGIVETNFFEARGHAYEGTFPRPVSPERIANAVIDAVDRGRVETFVPRWLRAAVAFRHVAPSVYLRGTRRRFRKELADAAPKRVT